MNNEIMTETNNFRKWSGFNRTRSCLSSVSGFNGDNQTWRSKNMQLYEGPTLLEFKTYRFRGHWTGDPEPYRTREEVKDWKENKDPIKLYKAYLLENNVATAEELEEIEKLAADKMAAAVEFDLNSPEPDPAHVLDDVFYEGGDAE